MSPTHPNNGFDEIKFSLQRVVYVAHMGSDLAVVNAARISHDGSSKVLEEKDIKLIDYLARNKHMSPFEHCTMTIMVECPLYIRSQIHRHRTFAYNEVSRRYTDEALEFYLPGALRLQAKINRQGSEGVLLGDVGDIMLGKMIETIQVSLRTYRELTEKGIAREIARGILPQCLMTKFFMTGNLRNWIHFVELRDHEHAQAESREIAQEIKTQLHLRYPHAVAALLKYATA